MNSSQCSRRQNHLLCTSSTWSPCSTSWKGSKLIRKSTVCSQCDGRTSWISLWQVSTKRKHAKTFLRKTCCKIFVSIHPSVHSVFIPVHCFVAGQAALIISMFWHIYIYIRIYQYTYKDDISCTSYRYCLLSPQFNRNSQDEIQSSEFNSPTVQQSQIPPSLRPLPQILHRALDPLDPDPDPDAPPGRNCVSVQHANITQISCQHHMNHAKITELIHQIFKQCSKNIVIFYGVWLSSLAIVELQCRWLSENEGEN